MLQHGKLTGFLITADYASARDFYEGRLGFEFVSQDQWALVVRTGGHLIRITRSPEFLPLRSTVLGWEVASVEEAVKWLATRGVETEKYPFVQDKELGIWTTPDGSKVAWFKDPDGNVLSVSQHP